MLVIGLSWLLTGITRAQPLTHGQQLVLLEQANRAFEQALTSQEPQAAQGLFLQAIAGYEQLIAAGVHNAKLYYNLGNAYFRRNDLGRAILQYRRGLRLEPGNRRLQANLSYARSQRVDQIDGARQDSVLHHVLFWQRELGPRAQWTLALTGYGLAWACAMVQRFRRHPAWRWAMVGAACFGGAFLVSTLLTHTQNTANRAGVVVAEEVVVRKGNGESYAPQLPQPLHAGTEFDVLEERGVWLAIRLANGTDGWIRRDSAALLF